MYRHRLFLYTLVILCIIITRIDVQAAKKRKFTYYSFFTNLSAQHNYYVYEGDIKWIKVPATNFKEQFYGLSLFSDNGVELDLFYRKFEAKSVFIAGGLWDTEKSIIGISMGKILTAEIKIPTINVSLPIDFSGGPYATFAFKNEYNFISGHEDLKVSEQKEPIIGFGVYTNIRFRIKFSQEKKYPSIVAGFKYFIPFNDFEYNPEQETVSYRLERKFFYIGIGF